MLSIATFTFKKFLSRQMYVAVFKYMTIIIQANSLGIPGAQIIAGTVGSWRGISDLDLVNFYYFCSWF